jgi:succinate dehydrogenase / fumarate reductase, iron-sulfur subunit
MSVPRPDAAPNDAVELRRFRVFRYKRGDPTSRFDTFEVPVGPETVVLEALRWIQLHRDHTLALRHSCFHASCGTCGIQVNGREVLGCVTAVSDLGRIITVEPMANIPVLADLVVDMRTFVERYPETHPLVRRSGDDDGERFEDCIECGLCLSACPIAATDDRYVGPAALAWAQRVLEEPRGADVDAVLDWADDEHGAWQCHAAFECTEACPSNVFPAQRIMKLRRELTARRLGGRRSEASR